jgi:hypothetical protein
VRDSCGADQQGKADRGKNQSHGAEDKLHGGDANPGWPSEET